MHDTRLFSISSLYKKGADVTLLPESQVRNINGAVVPVFIADAAYPFLPQAMKQSPHFNCRSRSTPMFVENALGHLKGRLTCLLKQIKSYFEKINNVVAACCTLHSIYWTFHNDLAADLSENVHISTERVCVGETGFGNKVNKDAEAMRNGVVQYCQDSTF